MVDKEKYLKDLQGQVNAAKQKNELGLSLFKQSSVTREYKEALEQIIIIKEPEDVKKAMELLLDSQQDISVRILVAQKIVSAISESQEYIENCFSILSNGTEPSALRIEVMNLLKTLSFFSKTFVALRSGFMALLRSLLDDSDPSLREMAAEELAKNKDEFVQRRLLRGLDNQEIPIVNDAKAIQLLGYDLHGEHFAVVRRFLQNDESNEVTKLEAIHVLANDPESKQLLINLMLDEKQSKEIRIDSAVAVQAAHPHDFIPIAKSLVLDEGEDKDLRIVSLNALTHLFDKTSLNEDHKFLEKVSELNILNKSPELKKISSRYIENANKRLKH